MTQAEFSRLVRLDALPDELRIEADAAERAALASRFGLVRIDRLAAEARLTNGEAEIVAEGWLKGEVVQSCVATGEAVPAELDEAFAIIFRPRPQSGEGEAEIELSAPDLDVVFFDGEAIDLGEAVAETLALSLDPYPRSAETAAALEAAGVKSEEEARAASSPFAALKGALRK